MSITIKRPQIRILPLESRRVMRKMNKDRKSSSGGEGLGMKNMQEGRTDNS